MSTIKIEILSQFISRQKIFLVEKHFDKSNRIQHQSNPLHILLHVSRITLKHKIPTRVKLLIKRVSSSNLKTPTELCTVPMSHTDNVQLRTQPLHSSDIDYKSTAGLFIGDITKDLISHAQITRRIESVDCWRDKILNATMKHSGDRNYYRL